MSRWTRYSRGGWGVLEAAVKGMSWEEVSSLLRDSNYSSSSVERFVKACQDNKVIHVDGELLSHCSTEQKVRLLKTAVKLCTWKYVRALLQDRNYSSSIVEQFVAACEQYFEIHVDRDILSHCSSEQKDRLLKIAVTTKSWQDDDRWNDVQILLKDSNYSSSVVEQFVTACEEYEVIHVDREILSHCSSEQKDRLLKTALKPGRRVWQSERVNNELRWNEVKILLQDCNYNSSSVEQFVSACEQNVEIYVDHEILSHCSSQQKDRLLETAVKKQIWKEVSSLLQDSNYSSSSVEQFIAACEQNEVIHVDSEILSHSSSEQKDRLLKTAVRKQGWQEVDILLHDSNYSSSVVEQFVTACEQYEVIHVDGEILSHCSSEQKDRLLKTALKPGRRVWQSERVNNELRWNDVKILLQDCNYNSSSVEQFVSACEQNVEIYVDHEILSHCSSEQRGRLLKTALNKKKWEEVSYLLQASNYSSSSVEQFVTACEVFDVIHVDGEILSHCSSQQKDRLLNPAVKNERWEGVAILLQDNGYSSSSVEQFVAACELYKVIPVDGEILSHCSSEQKDRLVKTALQQYRGCHDPWNEVKILLQDNDYSSSSVEQFVTACEQYDVIHVDREILSHCNSKQKDRLLKTAVKLLDCRSGKWWNEMKALLQDTNYSSSSVEQFVATCELYEELPVDGEILSHCSSEQKDRLLKTALQHCRGWNDNMKILLQDNYSSISVEQFVTACEQHELIHVDGGILSRCSSEQKDRLLKTAVKMCSQSWDWRTGERWNDVKVLLQDSNYSSSSVEQFVAACDEYDVIYIDREILSHCSSEQKDRLLKTAVKLCRLYYRSGKWWNEVKALLQDTNYSSSSVEQFVTACQQYEMIHIDREILPHCTKEQHGRLLETCVRKTRWEGVDGLLQNLHYSSSIVEELITACEQHGVIYVNKDLLSHCSSEQHGRLLETGVRKMKWEGVNGLLQYLHYSVSFVEQFITACEKYGVIHDCPELMSHCTTQQLDRLLTLATTLRQWNVVIGLLKACGSDEKRVWVIEQACRCACDKWLAFIMPHVNDDLLSHCNTEQVDIVLRGLTLTKRWRIVDKGLKAGASHETRVRVIEQAYLKRNRYDSDLDGYILPHVNDDFLSQCSSQQLDRLLTAFTTTARWQLVDKVLKVGGSHEKCAWVIEQASLKLSNTRFGEYILVDDDFLSQCSTQELDRLLTTFTNKRQWQLVEKVLKVCHVRHAKLLWVIEQAYETTVYNDFEDYILPHVDDDFLSQCNTQDLDSLLTTFTTKRQWEIVHKVLKYGGSHYKRVWVFAQACQTADYKGFEDYILPHVDGDFLSQCNTEQLDRFLTTLTTKRRWKIVDKVLKCGGSIETRALAIAEAWGTSDCKDFENCILPHVDDDFLSQCSTHQISKTLLSSGFEHTMSERGVSAKSRMWAMTELCKGLTYATVMSWITIAFGISNVHRLINSVSSNQLLLEDQSVALRFALQQGRWDVISRASLSQVCEQVRRHLFREAVYQERWTIVKTWTDHTLYDDERWWALEETYKHKQWDVMLQLAEHGLTEIELMRVRYRLAKHADWDVVLRMIGRGVDVTEVREVVESTVISRKTKTTTDRATQQALALRWSQLRQLEEKLTRASARRLKLPSTALQWRTVLFHLHRHPGTFSVPSRSQPGKTFGGLLLQRAIEQRLWHVVMHLVTLGLDTDQLDSLLIDMMRKRQWGVCRVLLEQRVSVQSCLSALSVFMEKNQWLLVARVMEFIVDDALKCHIDQLALNRGMGNLVWQCVSAMFRYGMCAGDAVRLKVMQRAMERREGSVMGECISTMQHYRLTVKEREELFQQAISRGVLQAVKPLVQEKDETEIQHRDNTMLAAIEQRQWDVVDCCQLQGVDIDMKDVHGETPLNREVRKEDMNTVEWKVVEELLVRGADPNVLDKDGWSVLNRAIRAKQWDIVRLLIECLGDIHKAARSNQRYETERKTPLQLLIEERKGEIIHHTLIWCPDQAKGVNDKGETTLHAIALDENSELFYYQIVRGVNPLTLTNDGHSVLLYATQNEYCPQRMVGECIRLGFSTHQPRRSRQTTVDITEVVTRASLNDSAPEITSPFLLAVLRGMPVVAHMLYESGSSSYSELLHLYTKLLDVSDHRTEDGIRFLEIMQPWYSENQQRYDTFMNTLTTFLPYLREMACTPRSLVSTCRLVISHCLTVRRRHERDVQDLDLTDRMKDFLLFSDLTDPDYQWFVYGTLPLLPPKYGKELKQRRGQKGLNRRRRR